jgi:hypothetical protein
MEKVVIKPGTGWRLLAVYLFLGCLMASTAMGQAKKKSPGIKLLKPKSGASFAWGDKAPEIVLQWRGPKQFNSYLVQVSHESASGPVVATFEISNKTKFTFTPNTRGNYRWWVAGVGKDGLPTQPGEIRTFTVDFMSPGSLKPSAGRTYSWSQLGPLVQFSWSRLPVAEYRLELALDTSFRKQLFGVTLVETAFSKRIQAWGSVFWRVRGMDPVTKWSKTRSFKIVPQTPKLVAPKEAMTTEVSGKSTSVKLSWQAVPQAKDYIVEIDSKAKKNWQPKKPLRTKDTSIEIKNLVAGSYKWKIFALHKTGAKSLPSPARTFELIAKKATIKPPDVQPPEVKPLVKLEFPAAPVLQAPEKNAWIMAFKPREIILFWKRVTGSKKYEVELSNSKNFSKVVLRKRTSSAMLKLSSPPQGTIYWRVRAVNDKGQTGKWSKPWKFKYEVKSGWGG